ncbi:carboxyl transferase [Acidimicrobium ferrooxidans DSM 10331]|uniref:Carboxyl transferase n=1 Tax=Acidimicrobium ferrooxidans (strain DSM 10331 / JCM 15462 / NBRC 103882 / ICP) TaxID=525909 RepID=C7M3E2_ACIFD|nr:carboxyl transferase domain-containing protein [Acidimicrobium ferrooxidans]ACU53536.1 carboxyl transferase [Acidimicrobium ferrooxidans DSM 10331]
MMREVEVPIEAASSGSVSARMRYRDGRRVMWVASRPTTRRGALSERDGHRIARAADLANRLGIPLVLELSTSGAKITDGVSALHGWGIAASALARCSGRIPILAGLVGPAVSGPALLLGVADWVVVAPDAFAFLSGPQAVREVTGLDVSNQTLGGSQVLLARSGVAFEAADDRRGVEEAIWSVLDYLPDSTDEVARRIHPIDPDPIDLDRLIPDTPTAAYDVRDVVRGIVDEGSFHELRQAWANQLVVGFGRIEGRAVGIVANQPMIMAGTLDIQAAQKGARFVRLCDSFNLPVITIVDTPGFLPGKDVEWRGMIRHGAELAFSYAACQTPRVCLIVRKAYGGAYIVMDSKGMGNDVTLAWPSAEIAVMGAQGAVEILHRRADEEARAAAKAEYEEVYLTPWIAAERGYVDEVIEPSETRSRIARAVELLVTKQEHLRPAKHANSPL